MDAQTGHHHPQWLEFNGLIPCVEHLIRLFVSNLVVFGCSNCTTSPSNILKFLTFSFNTMLLLYTALYTATMS